MPRCILQACAVIAALVQPCAAATFTYVGHDPGDYDPVDVFRLEGDIAKGDEVRLARAIERDGSGSRIVLELDSPGGDYLTGLSLAIEIRQRGIATVVRTGDYCHSACAIAFMGGSARLRDPMQSPDEIPGQLPERVLEPGAELGFHAPYLEVASSDYTAENVQQAYRHAVDGISLLIRLAGHLYIDPLELPRLLEPDRDDAFLIDTVDAIRTYWIDYSDIIIPTGRIGPVTSSMVTSACINRWHHRQGRSSLPGYGRAWRVTKDFEEGSALLGNGEEGKSFGVWRDANGFGASWLAYMPVTMTEDGRDFVWCLFESGSSTLPDVFYRRAGTVEELFEPLEGGQSIWEFRTGEGALSPGSLSDGFRFAGLKAMDMVPADTRVEDVARTIRAFQRSEADLSVPLR